MEITFIEILSAKPTASKPVKSLRHRFIFAPCSKAGIAKYVLE
jgi:hypothetical protein